MPGCRSRARTERQVWGGEESDGVGLVRTFVKKLRKPDDDVARPTYIFNERGGGYRTTKPGVP